MIRKPLAGLFALLVASSVSVPVLARQGPARQKAAEVTSTALSAARQALGAGRFADAVAKSDSVLATAPGNRDAVEIKTRALVATNRFDAALAAYDAYRKAAKQGDLGILGVIAEAELRRFDGHRDRALAQGALERLAGAGDAKALAALRTEAARLGAAPDALSVVVTLARLGERDAVAQLGSLLDSARADELAQVIYAVGDARAASLAPKVALRLTDPSPRVQAAAIVTVGALSYTAALPQLETLFKSDEQTWRLFAAVAIKRLGKSTADAYLDDILRRGTPEARLTAAEAYQSSPSGPWVQRVKELLSDRNEVYRLRAAGLIARHEPVVARAALVSALGSSNPLLRDEAARILESRDLVDVETARRLLGDPFDRVRLAGAGATLRAARSRATK